HPHVRARVVWARREQRGCARRVARPGARSPAGARGRQLLSGARRRLFRLGRSGALVALAAAIYGLAVLAFAAADRRAARDTFADGSTWNTGDDGASLAYAYLGGRHRVRTLVQPLDGAE